ncbi:MAG: GGDEF domain-containing protein [Myxococcota bacterium]
MEPSPTSHPVIDPVADPSANRAVTMMRRARIPLWIAMAMVGVVVIVIPGLLGVPTLSVIGVMILAALAANLQAASAGPVLFGQIAHVVYFAALAAVAYAIFGLSLPPVISVYFPAIVLLGAAQLLGARAALFWAIPSVALVAAAVFYAPAEPREVEPAITFAVRTATLLTILSFAVSFRRSQDRQSAELERRATTDALTGLANRGKLARDLDDALQRSQRFERRGAVVFLDLDGLKFINDTQGHAVGDELLRATADTIGRFTRSVDTAARLGGDEFVVLLSEYEDPRGAEVFARKLLANLCVPIEVAGQTLTPKASVGIAPFPLPGAASHDLLRLADDAMYMAKRAGGNRIFVNDARGAREVTEAAD